MHNEFERMCFDEAGLDVELRAVTTRITVKTGMYLSREWRVFLNPADLTVEHGCFLVDSAYGYAAYRHTHARILVLHALTCSPLSLLKTGTHAHIASGSAIQIDTGLTLALFFSPLPN